MAALRHRRRPQESLSLKFRLCRTSVALHQLDLLGTRGLDPRPSTLLDPAANPNAAPGKRFRLDSRRCESPLVAFRYRDGEILGPPLPEIHIDGAAALPHRQHLAFDDREPSAVGRDARRILSTAQVIIRIGPQAKPAVSR